MAGAADLARVLRVGIRSSSRSVPHLLRAWTAVAAVLFAAPAVRAQAIAPGLWSTGGEVHAVARSGNTVYLGGTFSWVAPATGSWAPLDIGTAQVQTPFPRVLGGAILSIVADGSGGWVLGGSFGVIGGSAHPNLAHVMSDGSVDAGFPTANGTVTSLVLEGEVLYLGGDFTHVGGQPRNRLAAVDLGSGSVTSWDPDADAAIRGLATSVGRVYAGGDFTSIGGVARSGLAALDAASGSVDPAWDPSPNGGIFALAVSGNTVYVGGTFYVIAGVGRGRVAALDATSGVAGEWNPNCQFGDVYALAVDGGTVYVGGNFTRVGFQSCRNLAAVDAASGAVLPWSPDPDDDVRALVVSGGTVYAGGLFTSVQDVPCNRVAAIGPDGYPTSWNPKVRDMEFPFASATISAVNTLVASGGTVCIGGLFSCVGGVTRNNLAALDTTTGAATAWNPNVGGERVECIALSGNVVYVGGQFESVGSESRTGIAAIDATTGQATSWDPGPTNSGSPIVYTIEVAGSTVYAGGAFTAIGGQSINGLAALSATTGNASAWNPGLAASDRVRAVRVSGGTVYVGGEFSAIGGQPRSNLAALNASDALATGWSPNPNGPVHTLNAQGDRLYAGGTFTTIFGGTARNRAAAFQLPGGLALPWNPNASGLVAAVVPEGNKVYLGGAFQQIGGQSRRGLAVVDNTNGTPTAWNPTLEEDELLLEVRSIAFAGGAGCIGGSFDSIDLDPMHNVAAIACPGRAIAYRDADGDGYGNAAVGIYTCDGTASPGYVTNDDDCNDTNGAIHPGAQETCNGLDDDCDGAIDNDGITCFSAQVFLEGAWDGSAAWGDMDADGDLDLVITGVNNSSSPMSKVYRNNGGANPTFTEVFLPTAVRASSVAWGDYDRDGRLDLLLTGSGPGSTRVSKLYRNSGGAGPTFTEIAAGLTGVEGSSVAWGDYDNDGDLDILLAGHNGVEPITRIYRNVPGQFQPIFTGLPGMVSGDLAWGDYDNDGDLDILISGYDNTSTRFASVFRNNGGANPTFTLAANLGYPVGTSSVAWGDYDADGDLDILLTGGYATFPDVQFTKVFRNLGNIMPPYFQEDLGAVLPGVEQGSAAWGDCDNSGTLDVLLAGLESIPNGFLGAVYLNTGGNPRFVVNGSHPIPVASSSAVWGDYDNDGDLDFLLTGTTVGTAIAYVYRNTRIGGAPNTLPAAPSGLVPSLVSGTTVEFRWNAATDPETPSAGLSYNLRVGVTPGGGQILAPMANSANGYRRIPALGNAGSRTRLAVTLPAPAIYYWSVQAINAAWAGGPFAPEQVVNVALLDAGDDGGGLPLSFALRDPSPNPFGGATTVAYDLPSTAHVRLDMFDVTGRRVRTLVAESQGAGRRQVSWDGTDDEGRRLPAGVYMVALRAGAFAATRRVLAIR